MHPYTVKNYLWAVTIALFIVMALLSGCSYAPKQSRLVRDQYCYTSQTITTQDKQTVSSETVVKCSDDPVEQYVPAKLGVAKDCMATYIRTPFGKEEVYACKKFDGTYRVVDSRTFR